MNAFLFDLDGTLVNSSPLHETAFRQTFTEVAPFLLDTFHYPEHAGVDTQEVLHKLGVDPTLSHIIAEKKRKYYRGLVERGHLHVFPGVKEFLNHLKERGDHIAIVTSASFESADVSLRVTGLIDYFRGRVVTKAAKAEGWPYSFATPHNKVFQDIIVVEDTVRGALAARLHGYKVWGVHNGDIFAANACNHFFSSFEVMHEYCRNNSLCR